MESPYTVCRKFHLNVINAVDVEDVRSIFKLKVYAQIEIGDTVRKTATDKSREKNPYWNYSTTYSITQAGLQNPNLNLVIKLYAARSVNVDKYISGVSTSIRGLLERGSAPITLPLLNQSRRTSGSLTFSYVFGEWINVKRLSLLKRAVNLGANLAADSADSVFQAFTGGLPLMFVEVKIFTEEDIVGEK